MNNISIRKAALINFISKYTNIFIQIIYSSVLSRILTPEDFGVVAVTTVFTTFFMLFADMGLGVAVVQNKTLTEDDTNNIFSFTFYMAIVLAILFAIFSIPLSIFYENRIYIPIGIILSFSLFFNTLSMIPNALLMKDKQFKLVGLRSVIVTLISGFLTIILGIYGLKYFAIALNSFISAFFIFVWNYKSVKLKLKFKIDKNSIIKVKELSSFQFAFSLVNYFSRNLDSLLIGKYMGSSALGYYDKAYKLMLYPVGNLTNVITPVLHPILSEHQEDKGHIYNQYIRIVKVLSLLGVFITAFCYFTGEEIIMIIFGGQWGSSVEAFKILSISIFFQMTVSSAGSIYQSIGNTKLMFKSGLIFTCETVLLIIIGMMLGTIESVAFCVSLSLIMKFFIDYYFLISKGFGFSVINFYKLFIPDLIIFCLLIFALYLSSFLYIKNVIISFIYKFTVSLLTYIAGLIITKQYKYFLMFSPNNKVKK